MLQNNDRLTEELIAAERADIWTALSQIRYIFTHGLLRDAAYAMQMQARRIELHTIAVDALEKIYADEAEHHFGELAYHAEAARLPEKALFYLKSAGKFSAEAYQNSLAADYFTRALAFARADDLITQFGLLAERVEMLSRMGKRDLQWKDINTLEQWAEEIGDEEYKARVLRLYAAYYFMIADYLKAIDYAKRADVYSASTADMDRALYTKLIWSTALLRLGRLVEARNNAQETLKRYRTAENRIGEGRVLTVLGLIALEEKEPSRAQHYLLEAVKIAREEKDPGLEARALNNLAMSEGYVNGNYALAREYYEQSYKIGREIGDRIHESNALGNLGFAAGMQGDFVAAHAYQEQALLVAREIGNRFQEMYALINLSSLAGVQADSGSALRYAQQASTLARKISERVGEAWAMLYMGHAYLLQNEFMAAQTAYQNSIDIRTELGQPSLSMEPIAGLVETFLLAKDLEAASREAEKILAFLDGGSTLDGTEEPLRVYYACYQLLRIKEDPRAKQLLQTAKNLLETQVSKFTDENMRKRYIENIPWRRAIWDAARDNHN
jgi:tetratricopeptide (TPR) repeat protein